MNEKKRKELLINPKQKLLVMRQQIFSMPPEKALDFILDAPVPAALVHSFPEEDFYFLINDIGLADSLPLIELASDRQWEYMLDVEIWQKDRLDIPAATQWIDQFLKADPARLTGRFSEQRLELMELILFNTIEVKIREKNQDPSDIGDDFFTEDDIFYVRINNRLFGGENESRSESLRKTIKTFLDRLSREDHMRYQKILLESASVIAAEAEEENFRLRNVRLAEKGFLPFDEAIGIYQPLKVTDLAQMLRKPLSAGNFADAMTLVPIYTFKILPKDNIFSRALQKIIDPILLDQLKFEFTGLCNQLIAADQKKIKQRDTLDEVVLKAASYLSIGLEKIKASSHKSDSNQDVASLSKYFLINIFQVAFHEALQLKWRAKKWYDNSWFVKAGLPLSFWDEAFVGVLGGLLIKKPLFFSNFKDSLLYKEFSSLEEVKATNAVLDEIIAFDDLLALAQINPANLKSSRFITYKNLLLTGWAASYPDLTIPENKLWALTFDKFKYFFGDLWQKSGRSNKIKDSMKSSFLSWLAGLTGLDNFAITNRMGEGLEKLFIEIENELGQVAPEFLDPKFIKLFII